MLKMNHQFTDATNGSSEAIHGILARLQLQGLSPHTRIQRLRRLSDIVLLHLQRPPPTCLTEESLIKFEPRDTLGPVCFEAVDLTFQHLQGSTREYLLQQWASFRPWLDLFLKKLVAPAKAIDGDDAINQEMLYDTMWSIVGHFISHCQPLSLSDSYPGLIGLTTGLWIHGSNQNILSSLNSHRLRSILHGKFPFRALGPVCPLQALPDEMTESLANIPEAIGILVNQFRKSCQLDDSQVEHIELLSVIIPFLVRHPALRQQFISGGIIEMLCALLNRILCRPPSQKFIPAGLFCQSLHILTITFEYHGPFCVRQAMRHRLLSTLAASFKFFGTSGPAMEYLTGDMIMLFRGIGDHLDHPIVLHAAQNALRALFAHRDWLERHILSQDPGFARVTRAFHCRSPEQSLLKLKRCGGCLEATYCSRACQKAHWKQHVPECRPPSPISQYSMAASPTASAFATVVRLESFYQLATGVSSGIIQRQIRSALARHSLTVIIAPGPCCRMTTNTPHIVLLPQILSGEEFLARPDEYGCDEVVKSLLLRPIYSNATVIYSRVPDAQAGSPSTSIRYESIHWGIPDLAIETFEIPSITRCTDGLFNYWKQFSEAGLAAFNVQSLRGRFYLNARLLIREDRSLDMGTLLFYLFLSHTNWTGTMDLSAGPVTPCPLSSTTTVSGFRGLRWVSEVTMAPWVRETPGISERSTSDELDFMQVSLQDLTRPLDELIGFEMPQGFQYNELLNIVATTVLDCNHATLNLSNRFAITRGPVSLEKRRRWFLSESIIALTRLRILGPFSFHKDVVELIGSKKPQGSQYNELLNIFAKPTYPPIMQDEMNSSHWTTWPGPTDDPVIILRKATDNVSSLLTHAGCRGVDSF
ncbi:hypothetical protein C8J56DRAFT_879768 [Mycena floridula]|nr:hypothetical protein C8J56DRAFT_879768 [Mycena floridula]